MAEGRGVRKCKSRFLTATTALERIRAFGNAGFPRPALHMSPKQPGSGGWRRSFPKLADHRQRPQRSAPHAQKWLANHRNCPPHSIAPWGCLRLKQAMGQRLAGLYRAVAVRQAVRRPLGLGGYLAGRSPAHTHPERPLARHQKPLLPPLNRKRRSYPQSSQTAAGRGGGLPVPLARRGLKFLRKGDIVRGR